MAIVVTPENARDRSFLLREDVKSQLYTWGGDYREGAIVIGPNGSAIAREVPCENECKRVLFSIHADDGQEFWANYIREVVRFLTGEEATFVFPGPPKCNHD